jgi:TatD DNase family protein
MDIRYIDAHCHLQFKNYDEDREAIIEQMRERGIAAVVVGCDLESSRGAVELAERYDHLFASVGLHPNHAGEEDFDADAYRALAKREKVVAVGECGLDYFRPSEVTREVREAQKDLFRKQITLAAELDKPLIIHARPSRGAQDAYHDIADILKEEKEKYPHVRGDMHFFAGGVAEAESFVALGFTLSFTAVITFARDYDEVICATPLTNILAETDAPYVAPASRRGERNDPLAVVDVVARIAEVRGEDTEAMRVGLLENTRLVFGLPSC